MPSTTATFENLMGASQGARALGISANAFCKLCDLGEIPHFRVGAGEKKRYKVRPSDVQAYLLRCQAKIHGEVEAKPSRKKLPDDAGGFTLLRQFGYRG